MCKELRSERLEKRLNARYNHSTYIQGKKSPCASWQLGVEGLVWSSRAVSAAAPTEKTRMKLLIS